MEENTKRLTWRAANLLNPLPAVLVTGAMEEYDPDHPDTKKCSIMTAAWAGTCCSDPVMVQVSIRPSRYSHDIIEKSGEFCVCLTTKRLLTAADYCGVASGRDVDKFERLHLTPIKVEGVRAPGLLESPVCLGCRVEQILRLGTHDLFLGRVTSSNIDASLVDEKGRLCLEKADFVAYSHGAYYALGEKLGTFGFSVRKKTTGKSRKKGGSCHDKR